ncbi:hypothetical protein T4C_12285 [Trichinella pseudospiralis]|uniref:Uncharacterized protein n=1 Tax=Trichinella pseudospiralis TaxID=6337 RepID=A0A0V1JCG2_TRIPS|nr:hypothetical protein T4C_12285 [Trichinella pseudospiralis]
MCGEFSVFPLLPGEGRLCVLPAQQSGGDFAFFLVFRGEEIRAFHEKNREGGGDFAFWLRWRLAPPALLPPCPPRHPCPGDFPRPPRLQTPVLSFTIFAEMTLGGSTHLIHPRRIGHSDPPMT